MLQELVPQDLIRQMSPDDWKRVNNKYNYDKMFCFLVCTVKSYMLKRAEMIGTNHCFL